MSKKPRVRVGGSVFAYGGRAEACASLLGIRTQYPMYSFECACVGGEVGEAAQECVLG